MNYMESVIEKITIERNKAVDSTILGEIQKIAVENAIETKIILNEKNIVDALRNYQDGYATIKAEVVGDIFEEIEKTLSQWINRYYSITVSTFDLIEEPLKAMGSESALRAFRDYVAELKKKYI